MEEQPRKIVQIGGIGSVSSGGPANSSLGGKGWHRESERHQAAALSSAHRHPHRKRTPKQAPQGAGFLARTDQQIKKSLKGKTVTVVVPVGDLPVPVTVPADMVYEAAKIASPPVQTYRALKRR
jgi:hypothetical protein